MLRILLSLLLCLASLISLPAEEVRLAILGDSLAYDERWPVGAESALRNTPKFADADIVNFGLASETASGLSEPGHAGGEYPRPCVNERIGRILSAYKPTLVIACYGINDAIYQPFDQSRFKAFREGMTRLHDAVEKTGAKIIFLTPPPYEGPIHGYDDVIVEYSKWLLDQRRSGWLVVDLHHAVQEAIKRAREADPSFVYAAEGIHPDDEGYRFIAEAACEGLWPLLKLPGTPAYADGPAFAKLKQRHKLLKDAWLTETKYQRPGLPAGVPLAQALAQAPELLAQYRIALAPKVSPWSGYERTDFTFHGRSALLVKPKVPAKGHPWVWRTEFFGHEPQADIALLGKGFHVAYLDMQNLYGGPMAMRLMDRFYSHLTQQYRLSPKTLLEGFSRGGLFAFNWAALRPDRVAGLYVDAPVCDFKSWPGGKGKGPGAPADWKKLLDVYALTEEQALTYAKNPVDSLAALAKAKVPIFAVAGDADEVVPIDENINLVEKRYRPLGGWIRVIRKPGGKHHPHSLPDPAPIVDFALKAAMR
ncbi:MAG TPA: GDSL-type esterase/lipase family protein [Luteolibacter sp.]